MVSCEIPKFVLAFSSILEDFVELPTKIAINPKFYQVMPHKNKVYRNLLLPLSMNEEITQLAKGKTLMNCYYILYIITYGYNKHNYRNFQNFRPIPTKRLFKMLGSGYIKPLNILLFNGFVERSEKFGVKKCFQYRIAPKYYNEHEMTKVKFSYYQKTDNFKQYEKDKKELERFIENFRLLEIPFDKLYSKIDSKVNSLSLDDYYTDDQVEWIYPKMNVTEIDEDWMFTVHRELGKKEALLIADQKNKVIVNDGKKICMVDPEYFMMEQRNFTRMAWTASVENLADESTLYGKRNRTNNRLDTNFTNMGKELFDTILSYNQMEEYDLRNSQPALLSHILKEQGIKSEDVELYHESTNYTGFYEYFGDLGLDRESAKQMVFKVLFGKDRVKSPMTELFKEQFPTVSNYISAYKWENGDNAFAIMLQQFESQLFIDNIYYKLCDLQVPVFSKHDSISFFKHHRQKVYELIMQEFGKIGFEGKIELNCPRPISA